MRDKNSKQADSSLRTATVTPETITVILPIGSEPPTLTVETSEQPDVFHARISVEPEEPPPYVLQVHEKLPALWMRTVYFRSFSTKSAQEKRIELPPSLWFDGIAKILLKKSAYDRYVKPAIADMQHEYIEALARNDERGARLARIRGNLYAIPGWVWALIGQVIVKVAGWIRA